MRIIELPENTIPYKDFKIYPERNLKTGKTINRYCNPRDIKYEHYVRIDSHVLISRKGVDYLIPLIQRFQTLSNDENIDSVHIDNVIDRFNDNADRIIEHYIIDESISREDSIALTIYKYKK